MTMGLKRMQGLGWVALVFLVAISLYPLSLNVGAMHAKLVRVDSQIVQTHKEISYLQAEIRARASLSQLERWNDLLYGYDAPHAAQYLEGERALADLQGADLGPRAPVMVSASYGLGVTPAGSIGNGDRVVSATSQAPGEARIASSVVPGEAVTSPVKPAAGSATPSAAVRHERRVAQLESSLLGQATLNDLQRRSESEKTQR